MKNQNSRETVFTALKLIEQLYIDGQLSRSEFIGILGNYMDVIELKDFIQRSPDRKSA